jgi:alkaline phosphatase D
MGCIPRRTLLKALLTGLLVVATGIRSRLGSAKPRVVFRHGIASGDPTHDSVILWTRISSHGDGVIEVSWQVAEDRGMSRVLASGRLRTDASSDHTVKVEAKNLPPGRQLFYRFEALGSRSATGRTKTLAAGGTDLVKLAVVSCSNFPTGFFNVYREIARRPDIDAVVHLGDYIYEYGMQGYGTEGAESLGRVPRPATELRSLRDYRERHAQYKSDPDSQAMLANHPLIAVWDDHELANDSWRGGAEAHSEEDGSWKDRRDAAIQAYFEWMPIRGRPCGSRTRIFRKFRFGDLASLIMLDTRLYGRDPQPYVGDKVYGESIAASLADPKRRLLGPHQERWLRRRLKNAGDTTWQVIGQQVLMSKVISPNLEPLVDPEKPSGISKKQLHGIIERSKSNPPSVLDAWDGYPTAREDLYADLDRYARNPVILSGDLHTNLAADLIPHDKRKPVAVEFMAGAVSSPTSGDSLPERTPNAVRDAVLQMNPWLKYLENKHRGWLCLTLTDELCTGEWHLIDTVRSRAYKAWRDKTLSVRAGRIAEGLQA